MKQYDQLISNDHSRFSEDVNEIEIVLSKEISSSNFLVIGGAGSIGQSVVKQIFSRNPKKLDVVDINENGLVELVRDIRSSYGYISGEFNTLVVDCDSAEFEAAVKSKQPYDYVLNLSALKHVRSEKDPFTLMRLIRVNILNTIKTLEIAKISGAKKYFCVSTDKATNPVNMMGASKRIMEMFLYQHSKDINISTARFANVAFSDGSLLDGFNKRFEKKQPITAPKNIKRYFINLREAGELCLLSCMAGHNNEIYFPKIQKDLALTDFIYLVESFLKAKGYTAFECSSEEEARREASNLISHKKWPCIFFDSDTTGEKEYEEFFTNEDSLNLDTYQSIGILNNNLLSDEQLLEIFLDNISSFLEKGIWTRKNLIDEFEVLLGNFKHIEKGKFLDEKM